MHQAKPLDAEKQGTAFLVILCLEGAPLCPETGQFSSERVHLHIMNTLKPLQNPRKAKLFNGHESVRGWIDRGKNREILGCALHVRRVHLGRHDFHPLPKNGPKESKHFGHKKCIRTPPSHKHSTIQLDPTS